MPKLILREKYLKLPQDLRDMLFNESSADVIGRMGTTYKLSDKNVGALADETGLVLFGALHPKDFIPDLSEKLGIDKETAKKIAEDVNREIFQKVRVSLRKLYGIMDDGEGIRNKELGITKEVPKPPQIPKPQPPPPKIVIKENIEVPKEVPKEELKPLEIRPIKGGPLGGETGIRNNEVGIREAGVMGEERPAKTLPQTQHDAGLLVMPHSPGEIGIMNKELGIRNGEEGIRKEIPKPPIPKPPTGMAIMEKGAGIMNKELGIREQKQEIKPQQKSNGDPYRERI